MKKLILLSLLFVFTCSKTPKWINTINNSDYYIESVGISTIGSKNESILKALMNMAGDIETQIKTDGIESTHIAEKAFGKVKIEGFTKHTREETGLDDSTEILDLFESVGELTFLNGNKKLKYSYQFSGNIEDEDSLIVHNFEMAERNCTLKDLIDYLNGVGCNFEFYNDDGKYYTLISYEKKRLLENIKQQ